MRSKRKKMEKKKYKPAPVDTRKIQLPAALEMLTEQMARNTHDLWAANRMAEGWTWGPVRNETLLQHPDLVPYDQLPESEKTYDRMISSEILKFILSIGYEIKKNENADSFLKMDRSIRSKQTI